MWVDDVLLPIPAGEIDRVGVLEIITDLDPEFALRAAEAERIVVDDPAVNGLDVNFVSHPRQSSTHTGDDAGSLR